MITGNRPATRVRASIVALALLALWAMPTAASASASSGQVSLAPPSSSLASPSVRPLLEGIYVECRTDYYPGLTCYGASGPVRKVEPYSEGATMCVGATGASGEKCNGEPFYVGSGEHEPWIKDIAGSSGGWMYVQYG
jgi:hypothetical protein